MVRDARVRLRIQSVKRLCTKSPALPDAQHAVRLAHHFARVVHRAAPVGENPRIILVWRTLFHGRSRTRPTCGMWRSRCTLPCRLPTLHPRHGLFIVFSPVVSFAVSYRRPAGQDMLSASSSSHGGEALSDTRRSRSGFHHCRWHRFTDVSGSGRDRTKPPHEAGPWRGRMVCQESDPSRQLRAAAFLCRTKRQRCNDPRTGDMRTLTRQAGVPVAGASDVCGVGFWPLRTTQRQKRLKPACVHIRNYSEEEGCGLIFEVSWHEMWSPGQSHDTRELNTVGLKQETLGMAGIDLF